MLFSGSLRLFAIHFLLYLPLVLVLQYNTGIYRSELSHHPDESAHVITSLMIHDYAKTGIGTSPLRFAENYYVHYPKVAFGIWPPVFHSTAALWMLLFSRTHTSLLIFIAVQCALCAATLAMFSRRLLPPAVAFGLGLLMILLPAFQNASSLMMVDIFLTLMELWAMMLLVALFRDGRMRSALWFGICTSLAMLTKGNANALVFCGVLLLLLTRQFSILKRPPVYVAGLIVVLLGLPWQLISLRLFRDTLPMEHVSLARFWMLCSGYTLILVERLSLPVFLVALVGLAAACSPMLSGGPPIFDAAGAASLLLAVFIFHCLSPTPGPDDRYILPALPLLLLFFALGIRWIASVLPVPRLTLPVKAGILAALCLGWFTKSTFAFTQRPEMGFSKLAAQMVPEKLPDEVVLVCSDSWGEGALITSLALADPPRSPHVILRGSKTLSENRWISTDYTPLFRSPAELETYLESVPVDAVVIDLSKTAWEQDRDLLADALRQNRDKWSLTSETQETQGLRHLQLYRWTGADHSNKRKNLRIRMRLMLGRDFQLK